MHLILGFTVFVCKRKYPFDEDSGLTRWRSQGVSLSILINHKRWWGWGKMVSFFCRFFLGLFMLKMYERHKQDLILSYKSFSKWRKFIIFALLGRIYHSSVAHINSRDTKIDNLISELLAKVGKNYQMEGKTNLSMRRELYLKHWWTILSIAIIR